MDNRTGVVLESDSGLAAIFETLTRLFDDGRKHRTLAMYEGMGCYA